MPYDRHQVIRDWAEGAWKKYWTEYNEHKDIFETQTPQEIRQFLKNRTLREKLASQFSIFANKSHARKRAARDVIKARR